MCVNLANLALKQADYSFPLSGFLVEGDFPLGWA